jgi:hypothetical protein
VSITLDQARRAVRLNLRAGNAEISDENIVELINEAIDFAISENMFISVGDETLVQTTDQYEYILTGGELINLRYITLIWGESNIAGLFTEIFPQGQWHIEQASTPFIVFNRLMWAPINGNKMRVVGLKPQARVAAPENIISLPSAWVTWKAIALGHNILSGIPNTPLSQWHRDQVGIAETYVEQARLGAKDFRIPAHARRVQGRY